MANENFGVGFLVYWYIKLRRLFNAKAILVEKQQL